MSFAIAGVNQNHHLCDPDNALGFEEAIKKYGVILLMAETSENELTDLDGELPSDTHLVRFRTPEGGLECDAVRSFTKADIFDAYHDAGLEVLEIKSGWGRIKPKLFTDSKK